MSSSNTILFYVRDAVASVAFHSRLLGIDPVEASPGFGLFVLPGGLAFGVWSASGVEPAPTGAVGGSELGFKLGTAAEVDATHAIWKDRGAEILQPPTDLDFGRSFVALDPDGHRLRVYAMAEEM